MDLLKYKEKLLHRFLTYVSIDSQSDATSGQHPSSAVQFSLARYLVNELKNIGIKDAKVDEHCYVTATIWGNSIQTHHHSIGLLAHLDTSPDVSGSNVTPHVIDAYRGGDINLGTNGVVILADENPHLKEALGHTIVTAGGDTLLGADDKAGIAAIITLAEYLMSEQVKEHHTVKIAFTPDEEIGEGVILFDEIKFGVDFAFTVDGGFTGEVNRETFSADSAYITIKGRNMHPGWAKNRMVNALRVGADIINRLPADIAPETTEDREGYIHPHAVTGTVGNCEIKILLRDFEEDGLAKKREFLKSVVDKVAAVYPEADIELRIEKSYRNMYAVLKTTPSITEHLERAVQKTGITPVWKPIRGGTDGSVLTARGVPTPNIFTGGYNAHSVTEWVDIDGLMKSFEVLVNIVQD